MLNVKEASSILELSNVRVKQLLNEHPDFEYSRNDTKTGAIKIPNKTMKKLLDNRGFKYKKSVCCIGAEKGGIGKSLLTLNVAINLSIRGCKVLVIDLDPESCATNFLIPDDKGYSELKSIYEVYKHDLNFKDIIEPTRYEGLDLVPCRGLARKVDRIVADQNPKILLKNKMKGLDAYDCILFEVPPTFSKIISSAYLTSDLVIMPTFPDAWSLESIQLTIDDIEEDCKNFEAKKPEIKILMNKFNPNRTASKDAWSTLVNEFKDLVLPYSIKESADLQNSINNGMSIFEAKAPKEVKEAIINLADLICPLEKVVELTH